MKILLIYNPTSGNGTFKNSLDCIIETAQNKGFYLMPYRISSKEALEELLSTVEINSFNRIWIAGGDGTIHQVINSLLRHECDIPIGIYPVGTANDFARYFNFPNTIIEMTEILLRDNYTHCDIGVANGEHAESPYVDYFQTAELMIDSRDMVGTDMDGEKGFDFPLRISIETGKLKIITRNNQEEGYVEKQSFSFHDVKKAVEMISNGLIDEMKKPFKEILAGRNTVRDMFLLAADMPRHNSINYINKNTLNDKYFEIAQNSLESGYLYIVLSSTGSAAGELIQKVTKKEYAHASIAFDEELETIVSYNGGENIYAPGLNQELIEFFRKKEDANIIIYKIKADRDKKQKVLDEIRKINREGSSYNILGLFVPYSHRENIMFCSQFVYCMLKVAGLNYFEKKPEEVKPTDFVELDYKRNLEYHAQVFAKEYIR